MNHALMSARGSVEEIILDDDPRQPTEYSQPEPQEIEQQQQSLEITPIKNNESWIKQRWRPAIAWQYVAVCMFDFLIAPILTMTLYNDSGNVEHYAQWTSITLQGGGLYHGVMGAIIGVYTWSRGQEKLKGIES